ncbi:hypothetical protein SAMN05216267_1001176 [Actinacidiphila rubida]|uniref:Uncharacterized protein n=1 Tax=Actinacidiphila rubida TaxID=310780 RepID=A0A1H8DLN5_9ACTN|nr:hypothetical protein [Actinacidiphila rubida]SEN08076.1 hypothetical protein SAMN05216267_1001176 [Actinacidiphila rubida]
MHSSGRGEESPEPYRGVVLPSGQGQPPMTYGEHVQPAAGTPWGSTPAPGAAPLPPPAADATQMLPPYPGGVPAHGMPPADPMASVPVADATQMLPPYPGGAPMMPPQPAQMQGGVPPVPPQQPPHQPYLPPTPPQGPQPEAPAEATQALPLSIFQEQDNAEPASYGAAPYGQQPGYDQGYGGQDFGGQDFGGAPQDGQSGVQHDSDYDHLFRQDVPSPAPVRPHIIQPHDRQQAPQGYGQGPGPGGPGYGQQGGYEPPQYGYDDAGDGGRRKMSPKVLIGIVVAGCVVAGLVVGGLLNSGGNASADNAGGKQSTGAGTPSASASGSSASGDAAKQQAEALDALLKTSGSSRSSVVNAVESIKNCDNLDGAAGDLRAAAGQRNGLVTKLGTLSVDKLPGHADLTDALTKAWHASASADSHYASWADQAKNPKVCKGGHAHSTNELQTANRESGSATEQKKRAVKLWNAIASQYGLTERQYSQL